MIKFRNLCIVSGDLHFGNLLCVKKLCSLTSKRHETVRDFKDIPGPMSIPIWGTLYKYKLGIYNYEQYHNVLKKLYADYGPVVKQKFCSKTFINVFEPEDIKTVYEHEGATPYIAPLLETTQAYRKKRQISPGLGNTNGDEWLKLRSAVRQIILRPQGVHYYLPTVDQHAKAFIAYLQQNCDANGEIKDLHNAVSKHSLKEASLICFGEDLQRLTTGNIEELQQQVINANKSMFKFSNKIKYSMPWYKILPTSSWRKVMDAEDFIIDLTRKFVRQTIERIQTSVHAGTDYNKYHFLTSLLAKKELSSSEVIVLTLSIFTDGLSTTVPAILFNLYCLATNPHVQEKAYAEIIASCKVGESISVETLNKLQYLKAIIKETFRFFPGGTEVIRINQDSLILSGYHIPAGCEVHLSPLVHFQSEKYFSSPEKFMPERWLRENKTLNVPAQIFTPFGHGTRTCAGRRLAEQDLLVLLFNIIRNFKLQYPDNCKPLQIKTEVLIFPNGPVRIKFLQRK